jgi:hypothetical protein
VVIGIKKSREVKFISDSKPRRTIGKRRGDDSNDLVVANGKMDAISAA